MCCIQKRCHCNHSTFRYQKLDIFSFTCSDSEVNTSLVVLLYLHQGYVTPRVQCVCSRCNHSFLSVTLLWYRWSAMARLDITGKWYLGQIIHNKKIECKGTTLYYEKYSSIIQKFRSWLLIGRHLFTSFSNFLHR